MLKFSTADASEKDTKQIALESGKFHQFSIESKQEVFSQVITCGRVDPSALLNQEVCVRIAAYEKKQGGMFEKSYVTYRVQTPSLKFLVFRRYNDFLWLKATLEHLHPGLPVPPIAKKGSTRRYDQKHLCKRMAILQRFLNRLLQIPQLKAELIVENFLKIADPAGFQKMKGQYAKISERQIPLNKLKNLKGNLNLVIDPKINNFMIKAQRYLMEVQPLNKLLYKEFKAFATALQAAVLALNTIQSLCKQIKTNEDKFRSTVELKISTNNHITMIEEMSEKFQETLAKQSQFWRKELHPMEKYESLNMLNFLDSFDRLSGLQGTYKDAKYALIRRKERLFEEGYSSKWGVELSSSQKLSKVEAFKVMLPKQTEQLSTQREIYALYNFQLYEELNRHFGKNNQHLGTQLKNISEFQSRLLSEQMLFWADFMTKAYTIMEGKDLRECTLVK